MKNRKPLNLSEKEKFEIISNIIQVALIIFTVIVASKAYQQTNNIFKAQNRPNMIVTETKIDSTYQLMLWNMGPGVAYDINVEIHFADFISNTSDFALKNYIESAIEMETKTNDEIFINMNVSSLGTINPPNTLPVGIEFSYKTKPFLTKTISGLIIILRYRDNMEEPYYSYFDGYNWKHSAGNFKTPKPYYPRLYPSYPVKVFSEYFDDSDLVNNYEYSKIRKRILKETKYLEESGFFKTKKD